MRLRVLLVVALSGVLAGCLAGCGAVPLTPLDASGGRLAQVADLHGATYVVGGGPTGELNVLCQLTIAAVQAAGAKADDQCGRIGSVDVRAPADQSNIDTGWAYVGRGSDARRSSDDLARADAAIGVSRLPPTAFGDVDAVVVPSSSPLRTVSALAASGPVTLCAPPGAADRVAAAYSLPVRTLDPASVLVELTRGSCTAGIVPGTSGRIPSLGLAVLDDDRGALSPGPAGRGGAAPILRTSLLREHPGVAAVLGEVTRRLDDATMRRLNSEADQQGREPRDVARQWLRDQGLIERG